MKKRLLLGGVAALVLASATPAMAQSHGPGCGVGYLIFKGQQGLAPQVLAATTNGTYSNQAFGISTGTIGCQVDGVVLREHERELYAAANLDGLKRDVVRGDGEYLAGLAATMGVSDTDRVAFATLAKDHADRLVGATDAVGFLAAFDGALTASSALAKYLPTS